MRKLLASAATLAVMAPMVASAESADSLAIQMNATVEDICTIAFTDADPTSSGLTAFSATVDQAGDSAQVFGEVTIQNSDDPSLDTIGDIDDFTVVFTANFFCNGDYEATIATTNGGLLNADDVNNTANFSNKLGYTVSTTFDATAETENPILTLNADGVATSVGPVTGSQHNGVITVTVSSGQSNVISDGGATDASLNLISGLYEDAMRITFAQDGFVPSAAFTIAAPDQAAAPAAPGGEG
jgi:hypothetical protein